MNVFIVGLPSSGRTAVSKALSQEAGLIYIDACSWIKTTFRSQNAGEHDQQFQEAFDNYLVERLKIDPDLYIRNITDSIKTYGDNNFIIDGLSSPRDFIKLFDYNKDIVIFLNRTDNASFVKDDHNIGVSVIRDYCYWLSSASLISNNRWIEVNFKMAGEDSEFVKVLESKNSLYLVKNLNKGIEVLKNLIRGL